jgi:hypothetical protein
MTSKPAKHKLELPSPSIVGFINRPFYVLLSVVGTVFTLEVVVMLLLMYLPPLTAYQEVFLDALLLSIIVFPALYLLIFRPISLHIELRQLAEEEKDVLISELQKALDEVKTLRGFIPICASCKKVRDDKGYWQQVEDYISAHSEAVFSHGICQECERKLYPDLVQKK